MLWETARICACDAITVRQKIPIMYSAFHVQNMDDLMNSQTKEKAS
jgi:hypothetical protein